MKSFKIDRLAQREFDEAAAWYEQQEVGLGFEFIEESSVSSLGSKRTKSS